MSPIIPVNVNNLTESFPRMPKNGQFWALVLNGQQKQTAVRSMCPTRAYFRMSHPYWATEAVVTYCLHILSDQCSPLKSRRYHVNWYTFDIPSISTSLSPLQVSSIVVFLFPLPTTTIKALAYFVYR